VATSVAGLATFGGGALAAGADVGQLVTGLASMNAGAALARTGQLIASAATTVWTGAQWLLNAALTANPIGIVIVVIAALVAAIIVAYKKSDTFRAVVQGAMRGVVSAFGWVWDKVKAVFGWLKKNWPLVLAVLTGPIGLAVRAILKHWDSIKSGVTTKTAALISYVRGIPGRIKGALGNLGNLLKGAGKSVIDGFLNGLRGGFDRVRSELSRLTNMLPSWKGPQTVDASILYGAGRLVMGGFERGLADGSGGVRATLGAVTASMPSAVSGAQGGGGDGGAVHIHTPAVITSDRDLIRLIDGARARTKRSRTVVSAGAR
jgi:phage-related protein